MRVISKIFRNKNTKNYHHPAAGPNFSEAGNSSSRDLALGKAANRATADASVHDMADLLARLSEEDRELLLVTAQRMAR